ncbi:MAG: S1 RNA-binding domain-containing protein [Brevinema sp.]
MSSEQQPSSQQGGVVTATVVSGNTEGWFLSTGGKSDVFMPLSETVGELAPGMEVEIVILRSKNGETSGSQKRASSEKTRSSLRAAMDDHTVMPALIEKLVTNKEGENAGFEVSINGVKAFLPMSQIRSSKDAGALVGKTFDIVVLDIKPGRMGDRIVVSERKARERFSRENFDTFVETRKVGDVLQATVSNVEEAFAILAAEDMSLFMHVTEFDWKYIKNLRDVLKIGDQMEVSIQSIDPIKRSVKVSRKACLANPIEVFLSQHKIGDVLKATVVRFARTLVIVESQEGAELVLPLTEISWTSRVSDPKRFFELGEIIEVAIKDIDEERRRVGVSFRDRIDNPWHTAAEKYSVGTVHEGTLTSITDFGIFLTFEDGIQGLVRREDIDWSDPEINISEHYQKGQKVGATVLSIEPGRERIRLGVKQLQQNPYQDFADKHPQGSLISARVVSSTKDGLDVDADGVFAFVHVSQISNEHVEDARTTHNEGDIIQAVVRRINVAAQRVELSIREVERVQEKKEIENFTQPSSSGPATLGDYFNISLPNKPKK